MKKQTSIIEEIISSKPINRLAGTVVSQSGCTDTVLMTERYEMEVAINKLNSFVNKTKQALPSDVFNRILISWRKEEGLQMQAISLKKIIEVQDDCIFIKTSLIEPKRRITIKTDGGYERILVKTRNDKLILN